MMRLEVLELIQMQMQGVEAEQGFGSQSADLMDLFEGSQPSPELPVEVPHVVNFEDITDVIQELRILVSKRGMDNMIVGSLLALPTAMLPLQDVEDNTEIHSGEAKSENQSPSKSSSKKKTLQASELIAMMDATTEKLSNQVTPFHSLVHIFAARSKG
jgi:hypothetical protein